MRYKLWHTRTVALRGVGFPSRAGRDAEEINTHREAAEAHAIAAGAVVIVVAILADKPCSVNRRAFVFGAMAGLAVVVHSAGRAEHRAFPLPTGSVLAILFGEPLVTLAEPAVVSVRAEAVMVAAVVVMVAVIADPSSAVLRRAQSVGAITAGADVVAAAFFAVGKRIIGGSEAHSPPVGRGNAGAGELRDVGAADVTA